MSILGKGFEYRLSAQLPGGPVIDLGIEHNLVPQEGVDFWASLFLGSGATPNANWYMGLFEGNYVPTKNTKAADLPGVVGECVAYSQVARPRWLGVYDGESVIRNITKTIFTMTADKTINGAFIVSSSTKAGDGGVLVSIARFASPKVLAAGTEFGVLSDLPLIPTDF